MNTLQDDPITAANATIEVKREPRTIVMRVGEHTQVLVADDKPHPVTRKPHELLSLYQNGSMHTTECKVFLKSMCNILMMEAYQALKMHVFASRRGDEALVGSEARAQTVDARNEQDEAERHFDSIDGSVSDYMTAAAGHETPMKQSELASRLLTTRNYLFEELQGYEDVIGENVRIGDKHMYRAPIYKHLLEKENAYSEFQPQSFEAHMEWQHEQAGRVNEQRLARVFDELAPDPADRAERTMIREMQEQNALRLQERLREIEWEVLDEASGAAIGCEDLFGSLPRITQERILVRLIGTVQRTRMRFIRNAEMTPPAERAEAVGDVTLLRQLEKTLSTFAADCGLNASTLPQAQRMVERSKMSPVELAKQLAGQRQAAKNAAERVGTALM